MTSAGEEWMGPDQPWVLGLVKYMERSLYSSISIFSTIKRQSFFS